MEALIAPVLASESFKKLEDFISEGNTPVLVDGLNDIGRIMFTHALGRKKSRRLIVTWNEDRAKKIYDNYRFFDKQVYLYPAKDALFYSADIHSNAIVNKRLEVVRLLAENKPVTVVLTVDALLDKLPELSETKKNRFLISIDTEIELKTLKSKLSDLGYERRDMVEEKGEYAIRGGIVDIFPLAKECPYRIEFFGDTVDSIRSFDVESQRSIENVKELEIFPSSEFVMSKDRIDDGLSKIEKECKTFSEKLKSEFKTESYARIKRIVNELREELCEFNGSLGVDSFVEYFYDKTVSFLDYFIDDGIVFLDDEERIYEKALDCYSEFEASMESREAGGYILPGQKGVLFSVDELYDKMRQNAYPLVLLSLLNMDSGRFFLRGAFSFPVRNVPTYRGRINDLLNDMRGWKSDNMRQLIISPSATRGKRLADNLEREGIIAFFSDNKDRVLAPREIMVTTGHISEGFVFPDIGLVVISESNIMPETHITRRRYQKRRFEEGERVKSFDDLSVGDYVVHEQYGLGIYRGIETIRRDDVDKDFIVIEYADEAKLYTLCANLEAIQKYASASERQPKLNRLGGKEWVRTKGKVKEQVELVAKELVELYAIRQSKEGFVYNHDSEWQKEFEEMFPYEETEDQIAAIRDTKKDMEGTGIMDRLICGDVGFGKTEIAIRAAFKAVQDSRQVAYLVPTTILCDQHFRTFVERMKDFPVKIRMLSRFCSTKEIKETLKGMATGEVDIVIGTHRLLSKDVTFKHLGLLIIDEEQRFGVTHKEKIKQLKKDVDVLTLTATPIPRTLHMSLVGIRDMSLLSEPPIDRHAIQTYVLEYNEELIKEAILRELKRNGQVFYVYNRVSSIDVVTMRLQEILPDVRIAYAHGQMRERELEDIMMKFTKGDIDVLVSTTIIETGLDIANVNTMIIQDADRFGLSQLYQLRGRIGRSNRNAYAFLMYKRDKQITETAEKRLAAIREFTDLGSGYKIAMRDLEIRGAGNLLGKEQSGNMAAVGYDLYCRMLNEEILRQKGEEVPEESFDTRINLPMDAIIPATYVKNEFVKLSLYKRIALISSEEDYEEMCDELIDRFGDMPRETTTLLMLALIKAEAKKAYIRDISMSGNKLKLLVCDKPDYDPEKITDLVAAYKGKLRIDAGKNPAIIADMGERPKKEHLGFIRGVVDDILGCVRSNIKE
ncbi:MAG: transcription-repair coupling factor [Lachnospiraceae bacterium]|nr:transcription-repair coupling factor [Lachnospiraceae bacterium]